jgi:hypothetical protein
MDHGDLLLGSLDHFDPLKGLGSQRSRRHGIINKAGTAQLLVNVPDSPWVLRMHVRGGTDFTVETHALVVTKTGR